MKHGMKMARNGMKIAGRTAEGLKRPASYGEDTARNERQARRNTRIRGLLKNWRDNETLGVQKGILELF